MTAPLCLFLPGLVLPAEMRYAALFRALGEGRELVARDLAVAEVRPEGDYSIQAEIDAIDALLRERGRDRCHLYGHSAGGAVALAYVAARPERVASLVLDEPSTDFSDADRARPEWSRLEHIGDLPLLEGMLMFRRFQVGPEVSVALSTVPPWMEVGPPRIAAFARAVRSQEVAAERYRRFGGPVLFTYGTLTAPKFETIRDRLAGAFPRMRVGREEGLHHLRSAHQASPERTAGQLTAFWDESERGPAG